MTCVHYLALLSGNDDVLVTVATLFGRAIDAAAGVHHITHQIPVRSVGRRHNCQVQRQLQQLLHSLSNTTVGYVDAEYSDRCFNGLFNLGSIHDEGALKPYLKQSPVLTDEPLWVVLAGLHGRFNQRRQGFGKGCLLFEGEVLFLVLDLAANFQHAGLFEKGAWRNDRLPVTLLLLSGCCWANKVE